jgi:tetratricopeptide (TPR) repeat protein
MRIRRKNVTMTLVVLLGGLLLGCSHPVPSTSSTSSASLPASPLPAVPTVPPTAAQLERTAIACMRSQDMPCAEAAWTSYIKLRPTDAKAIANLGFALNKEGNDEAAIVQFRKAIDLGQGTYDLFGLYADSLGKVGRVDDAIDWSYKTLKLVPSLVDIRGQLAKLLVLKKRYYEALTLLAEFDEYLDSRGQGPYFSGERIAIESALQNSGQARATDTASLRLVKLGDQFYAPVNVGDSNTQAFVVDTGASEVVLNDNFLVASKAKYTIARIHSSARTADGRLVDGKLVVIDHMLVGPFELDNVNAMVCGSCALLLGENALSKFDLNTSQVQGVDILTMTAHHHT